MRYLTKGDSGILLSDESDPRSHRATWRRNLGRKVLAILCLLLAGIFGFQFLHSGNSLDHGAMAFTPEWDDPLAALSWLEGHVIGWAWQLRNGLSDALPPGNYRLILKMGLCAVAAAVFLHSPRKN